MYITLSTGILLILTYMQTVLILLSDHYRGSPPSSMFSLACLRV